MSLSALAIATGIAALSITDPTTGYPIIVRDVTAIPEQVQARDCPILFPHPNTWIGGANDEPTNGPASFGTPTTRFWLFGRKFQYVYLHTPVGSKRGLVDIIAPMSGNVDAIMTAITTLDLSTVDVKSVGCSAFGVLTDPSSGKFFGCYIDITLRERLNQ